MPLPKLDESQIAWIIREVARYIETQRQSYRLGTRHRYDLAMAAEISSPSALARWTEHRKACAETASRFFCARSQLASWYSGRD